MIRLIQHTSYLVILLSVVVTFSGCGGSRARVDSKVDRDAEVTSYRYVTFYDSTNPGFFELLLMDVFRDAGFKVIGLKDASEFPRGQVIAVQASERTTSTCILTVALEDFHTDKALLTIRSEARDRHYTPPAFRPNAEKAWQLAADELALIFPPESVD